MATFSFRIDSAPKVVRYILVIGFIFIYLPAEVFAQRNDVYDPTTLVFPSFLHTYGIRKATRFHLLLFTLKKVQFDDPQGLAVVRLLSWDDTASTSDDDEVTVYGINSGQNCIIYNSSMKSLGIYGLNAKGSQRLNRPRGVAANEKGEVYIADTGNNRIVKLFNPGHELIFQKEVGKRGMKDGQFNGPCGVALNSQGIVYVTDCGNNRVQVFSSELQFLQQWGEPGQAPGQLSFPDGIAVTDKEQSWSYYRQNFIVVIDLNHSRIQLFDPDGNYLRSLSAATFGYPECYLAYITLDYYDNIYITDTKNHCIHKFDHQLNYLTSYGRYGDDDKEFDEPRGITNYRRFGQMFVAEKRGAQYYWIGTDCFEFKIESSSSRNVVLFKYFLTEPSFITTDILDSEQRLITRLWTKRFRSSGSQADYWNGQIRAVDDSVFIKENMKPSPQYQNETMLPSGNYKARYKIEPTYSSYHYFEKIVETAFKK